MSIIELPQGSGLSHWFDENIIVDGVRRDTRAYVIGVMAGRLHTDDRFDDSSIVLLYNEARNTGSFEQFQFIGDLTLWSGVIRKSTYEQHRDVYETLGRLSYYACYRMMSSWTLYEELADELPRIVNGIYTNMTLV